MAETEIRVGQLRWPVIVARRRENFDPPGGISIFEDWVQVELVHAEILPISALTFYGAEQVDMPVTHRITTRFLGYLDNTFVIARNAVIPGGAVRGELFRIRRVKELNGRKRFTSLDVELERVTDGPVTAPDNAPVVEELLGSDGQPLVGADGEPVTGRPQTPLLGSDGQPVLGRDGAPLFVTDRSAG